MEPPREQYVDEHRVVLAGPRASAWPVVRAWVEDLAGSPHGLVGAVLGTQPRAGFEVAEEVEPERVVLKGRHRFSRYSLVLLLDGAGETSVLRARTYADFPGPHGRAYRALVIGTGLHVVATRRMLRQVAGRVSRR